jgi:hypothetical protein
LPDGFGKTILPKQDIFSKTIAKKTIQPSVGNIPFAEHDLYVNSGATWFIKNDIGYYKKTLRIINCATPEDVYKQLEKKRTSRLRTYS